MVDFIFSDVFIQSTISTFPQSFQLCDVTLPEEIASRKLWQRWENCGTSFVAQQEPTCERETSGPLLGAQSPLQTDGTTERTTFVPYVFSSLMDANICSMSFPLRSAWKQEDLTEILFAIFEYWVWGNWQQDKTVSWKSHLNIQFALFIDVLWFIEHHQRQLVMFTFSQVSKWSSVKRFWKYQARLLILVFSWICSSVIPIIRLQNYYQSPMITSTCPYQLNTMYPCSLLFAVARFVFSYGEASVDFNLNPIS